METLLSREMADEQERLTGGNVRGSIVRAHLQWVAQYGNASDWQQLWRGLEDEIDRAFSRKIDARGMVSLPLADPSRSRNLSPVRQRNRVALRSRADLAVRQVRVKVSAIT
jgi:hypothetical protein